MPPQSIQFLMTVDSRSARVRPERETRDPDTYGLMYIPDQSQRIPVVLFAKGYEYRLFGLFPHVGHLLGTQGRTGRVEPVSSGGRRAGPRPVFAYRPRDSYVAADRPGGRRCQYYRWHGNRHNLRILRRLRRPDHPALHRDSSLDSDDPAVDGAGRRDSAHLGYDAGVFHRDDHRCAPRLDTACARAARQDHGAASRGLRLRPRNSAAPGRRASCSCTCCH